ncbi:MAG: hypothetical protein QXT77_08155 [Candidatus Methanomethylicaceae archaeon]
MRHNDRNDEKRSLMGSEQISRRDMLRIGIVSAVGLVLSRFNSANAQLRAIPVPCGGTISELPQTLAQKFYARLRETRRGGSLFRQLEADGFTFYPDRVKAFLTIATPPDREPRPSGTLTVVPSFKPFSPTAPSHTAWSIVNLYNGCIDTTIVGGVVVDHSTWQLSGFIILEFSPDGALIKRSVPREIVSRGVDATVAALGLPSVDPRQWDPRFGVPDESQLPTLASYIYESLLRDRYASPLYPPGAISRLLRDTPLIQTYVQANVVRYGIALRNSTLCTSTSTSCNACTSTSSSCFTLDF